MSLRYWRIKDFKGIEDLSVPKDLLSSDLPIYVLGENRTGKTSFIDAIEALFKGTDQVRVRKGAERAELLLGAGNLDVRRTIGKTSRAQLTRDGEKVPRPQEELNNLTHGLGFSPRRFVGMRAKEQARLVLEYLNLPLPEITAPVPNLDLEQLGAIDYAEKAEAHWYGARREANKALAEADSRLEALEEQIPEDWKGPLADPEAERRRLDRSISDLDAHRGELRAWKGRRTETEQEVRSLVDALGELKVELAKVPDDADIAARCDQKKLEETAEIDERITTLEAQITSLKGRRAERIAHWDERKENGIATYAKRRRELEGKVRDQVAQVETLKQKLDEAPPYDADKIEREIEGYRKAQVSLQLDESYARLTKELDIWREKRASADQDAREYQQYLTEVRQLPQRMLGNVTLPGGLTLNEQHELCDQDGIVFSEIEESRQELIAIELMAYVQEHYQLRVLCLDGTGMLDRSRRKVLDEKLTTILKRWAADQKAGTCLGCAIFVTEIPREEIPENALPITSMEEDASETTE